MRGKLMSTTTMLLLAWNSSCFAVTAELRESVSAPGAEVSALLPLPGRSAGRADTATDEVAMANIHPDGLQSWLQLTEQPELAKILQNLLSDL